MNNNWVYFIFVGGLCLLILVLIYYYAKKFIKRTKKQKKEESISLFKCLDGHKVRSKGEMIIDNYLYILGINHIYEKKLKIMNNRIICDWYLRDFDVYIEYWGFHGKQYLKRKKEKIKLYKEAKLKLISIENYMFSDIYSHLNKNLKPYIKIDKYKELDISKRYCYNCGVVLDERY